MIIIRREEALKTSASSFLDLIKRHGLRINDIDHDIENDDEDYIIYLDGPVNSGYLIERVIYIRYIANEKKYRLTLNNKKLINDNYKLNFTPYKFELVSCKEIYKFENYYPLRLSLTNNYIEIENGNFPILLPLAKPHFSNNTPLISGLPHPIVLYETYQSDDYDMILIPEDEFIDMFVRSDKIENGDDIYIPSNIMFPRRFLKNNNNFENLTVKRSISDANVIVRPEAEILLSAFTLKEVKLNKTHTPLSDLEQKSLNRIVLEIKQIKRISKTFLDNLNIIPFCKHAVDHILKNITIDEILLSILPYTLLDKIDPKIHVVNKELIRLLSVSDIENIDCNKHERLVQKILEEEYLGNIDESLLSHLIRHQGKLLNSKNNDIAYLFSINNMSVLNKTLSLLMYLEDICWILNNHRYNMYYSGNFVEDSNSQINGLTEPYSNTNLPEYLSNKKLCFTTSITKDIYQKKYVKNKSENELEIESNKVFDEIKEGNLVKLVKNTNNISKNNIHEINIANKYINHRSYIENYELFDELIPIVLSTLKKFFYVVEIPEEFIGEKEMIIEEVLDNQQYSNTKGITPLLSDNDVQCFNKGNRYIINSKNDKIEGETIRYIINKSTSEFINSLVNDILYKISISSNARIMLDNLFQNIEKHKNQLIKNNCITNRGLLSLDSFTTGFFLDDLLYDSFDYTYNGSDSNLFFNEYIEENFNKFKDKDNIKKLADIMITLFKNINLKENSSYAKSKVLNKIYDKTTINSNIPTNTFNSLPAIINALSSFRIISEYEIDFDNGMKIINIFKIVDGVYNLIRMKIDKLKSEDSNEIPNKLIEFLNSNSFHYDIKNKYFASSSGNYSANQHIFNSIVDTIVSLFLPSLQPFKLLYNSRFIEEDFKNSYAIDVQSYINLMYFSEFDESDKQFNVILELLQNSLYKDEYLIPSKDVRETIINYSTHLIDSSGLSTTKEKELLILFDSNLYSQHAYHCLDVMANIYLEDRENYKINKRNYSEDTVDIITNINITTETQLYNINEHENTQFDVVISEKNHSYLSTYVFQLNDSLLKTYNDFTNQSDYTKFNYFIKNNNSFEFQSLYNFEKKSDELEYFLEFVNEIKKRILNGSIKDTKIVSAYGLHNQLANEMNITQYETIKDLFINSKEDKSFLEIGGEILCTSSLDTSFMLHKLLLEQNKGNGIYNYNEILSDVNKIEINSYRFYYNRCIKILENIYPDIIRYDPFVYKGAFKLDLDTLKGNKYTDYISPFNVQKLSIQEILKFDRDVINTLSYYFINVHYTNLIMQAIKLAVCNNKIKSELNVKSSLGDIINTIKAPDLSEFIKHESKNSRQDLIFYVGYENVITSLRVIDFISVLFSDPNDRKNRKDIVPLKYEYVFHQNNSNSHVIGSVFIDKEFDNFYKFIQSDGNISEYVNRYIPRFDEKYGLLVKNIFYSLLSPFLLNNYTLESFLNGKSMYHKLDISDIYDLIKKIEETSKNLELVAENNSHNIYNELKEYIESMLNGECIDEENFKKLSKELSNNVKEDLTKELIDSDLYKNQLYKAIFAYYMMTGDIINGFEITYLINPIQDSEGFDYFFDFKIDILDQ